MVSFVYVQVMTVYFIIEVDLITKYSSFIKYNLLSLPKSVKSVRAQDILVFQVKTQRTIVQSQNCNMDIDFIFLKFSNVSVLEVSHIICKFGSFPYSLWPPQWTKYAMKRIFSCLQSTVFTVWASNFQMCPCLRTPT